MPGFQRLLSRGRGEEEREKEREYRVNFIELLQNIIISNGLIGHDNYLVFVAADD